MPERNAQADDESVKPRVPPSGQARRLRIASGLVLLSYIFLHLLNHAVGIISLDAMEAVQDWLIRPFRSTAGTILLGGAAAIHFGLALWAVYLKRHFAMPWWEMLQILLGLSIPSLLVQHVVTVRVAFELFATDNGYSYVIWAMHQEPILYATQSLLLIVAWSHGCIGIHYWLRMRRWYPRVSALLGAIAIVLPLLALIGFLEAAREVGRLLESEIWRDAFRANEAALGAHGFTRLAMIEADSFGVILLILFGLVGARGLRCLAERGRGIIRITFPGGQVVAVTPGPTVLEISRNAGLPHASVCGGRARCSTCRVRVGRGAEHLPLPTDSEARVLARIDAADSVRLACQIRPTHALEVTPLYSVPTDIVQVRKESEYHQGQELEIAVMFADLRGFTTASEHRLPYDTVFLLNRYFAEMGQAITDAGGVIDKYIGDGIMALFGLEDGLVRGTTNALKAAQEMSARLERLNQELRRDLDQPLKIGIGIHAGVAIVGEFGWGPARALTAIGDTVNTASRIEGLTKRFECELVISDEVARIVGVALDDRPRQTVDVRGREGKVEIIVITDPANLPILDAIG